MSGSNLNYVDGYCYNFIKTTIYKSVEEPWAIREYSYSFSFHVQSQKVAAVHLNSLATEIFLKIQINKMILITGKPGKILSKSIINLQVISLLNF